MVDRQKPDPSPTGEDHVSSKNSLISADANIVEALFDWMDHFLSGSFFSLSEKQRENNYDGFTQSKDRTTHSYYEVQVNESSSSLPFSKILSSSWNTMDVRLRVIRWPWQYNLIIFLWASYFWILHNEFKFFTALSFVFLSGLFTKCWLVNFDIKRKFQ